MRFKLVENILLEGTRYDKKAADIIVNSGLFNEQTASKIIDSLYKEDIHAFVHSPSWLEKYLVGIARMLVEYSNGDKNRAQSFLQECPSVFDSYLEYVKEKRLQLQSDKDKVNFDNQFNQSLSYEDVKNIVTKIQDEIDKESSNKLSKMKFEKPSNYELIPIQSYEQMHNMFGGRATGDGSSDKYAGGGGTAWYHTNSETVYNNWASKGYFFVLANKNWKNIPFDPQSNSKNAKDAYGNSLIAILVSKSGKLLKATLRSNHVGKFSGSADKQYKSYSELSEIAGFNVEEAVMDYLNNNILKEPYSEIVSITIPNSVQKIDDGVFENYTALQSVTIPNSVVEIGDRAFANCSSLQSITIPSNVQEIGSYAFCDCSSLRSIIIPNSVKVIGEDAFSHCNLLESITIPSRFKNNFYDIFDKDAIEFEHVEWT